MLIYLAGNFLQMITMKKEASVLRAAVKRSDYNRLVFFYFSSGANNTQELTDHVIQAFEIAKRGKQT